jgi:hypothetical protein
MTTIDMTLALLQGTEIDTIIKDNINPLLLGNEKDAWLESAFVDIVNSSADLTINVRCRNKQRTCVPYPFGGEKCFTMYEDHFTISFQGAIPNSQQCSVSSYSVTTQNEIYKVLAAVVDILVNNPTIKDFITGKICSQIPAVEGILAANSLFTFDTNQCVAALGKPVVECNLPVNLTEVGKNTFAGESFGIILDASCNIGITFNKQDLLGRVIRDDSIAIPPQNISCTLTTNGGPLVISFTVAPIIKFSGDGKAESASIGLNNVQGIPAFLGRVLAKYVNTSQELSSAIIEFVNQAIGV